MSNKTPDNLSNGRKIEKLDEKIKIVNDILAEELFELRKEIKNIEQVLTKTDLYCSSQLKQAFEKKHEKTREKSTEMWCPQNECYCLHYEMIKENLIKMERKDIVKKLKKLEPAFDDSECDPCFGTQLWSDIEKLIKELGGSNVK